ncbi:MAG: zinc-ribbon domain-containing protein [Desulfobulbus sp.]
MLAICEECSKKYNIDESKMKGTRARFSCQECGHIIVVVKSNGAAAPTAEDERPGKNPADE